VVGAGLVAVAASGGTAVHVAVKSLSWSGSPDACLLMRSLPFQKVLCLQPKQTHYRDSLPSQQAGLKAVP